MWAVSFEKITSCRSDTSWHELCLVGLGPLMLFKLKMSVFFAIFLFPVIALSFATPNILQIKQKPNLPMAMHHGLQIAITPINDPNLSGFRLEIKQERASAWVRYLDNIWPHDGRYITIPYRTESYALSTGKKYNLKLCAVFGPQENCVESGDILISAISSRMPEESRDADDDGYVSINEYNLGTDPRNPDSDNDWMSDFFEIGRGFDPNLTQRPFLEVENTSLDFGRGDPTGLNPGQHKIITIANKGQRVLRITDGILSGNGVDGFHYHNDLFEAVELVGSNHRTVAVDFLPRRLGAFTAQLNILSDDKAHFPVSINLSGVASNVGNLKVESESPLDFGSARAGEDGQTKVIKVSNVDADSPIQISLLLRKTLGFLITPLKFSLDAGASREVKVTFLPDWSGSYEGLLEARAGNSANASSYQMPIKANGDSTVSTSLRLQPATMYFGSVGVGTTVKKQLVIYNDALEPVFIKQIDFGMDGNGGSKGFSISSPSIVVPPRGSNRIEVSFAPARSGAVGSVLCVVSSSTVKMATVPSACKVPRQIGMGVMFPDASHGINVSGVGL